MAKVQTKVTGKSITGAIEEWAVNKTVGYNVWANFGKNDFLPRCAKLSKDLNRSGITGGYLPFHATISKSAFCA